MKPSVAAAIAALAIGSLGTAAHAAVYNIGPVDDGDTYSAPMIKNLTNSTGSTVTFTDYFNFSIPGYGDELSTAGINAKTGFNITGINLTLFSGAADNGVGTPLGSTGFTTTPHLNIDDLTQGSYYIEAQIEVAAHSKGSYNVATTFTSASAAPEPASWMLMIFGIGLTGAMIRFASRRAGVLASA